MTDSKRLYFIPILARALSSDDSKRAMKEAFDEIRELSIQKEYKEGFRQFSEFVKTAIMPSGEETDRKIQMIGNAIHGLIYDLVTDTFDGGEDQKNALINAIKSNPEWGTEYERVKDEVQNFLAPEPDIGIEVLMGEQLIGSSPISRGAASISSIFGEIKARNWSRLRTIL